MSSAPSMHRLPMLRSCSALQMSSSRCLSKPSASALLRISEVPCPGGSQICSLCVCKAKSLKCSKARRHADWHALSWDLHVCPLMGQHIAQDKLQPGVVISRRICVKSSSSPGILSLRRGTPCVRLRRSLSAPLNRGCCIWLLYSTCPCLLPVLLSVLTPSTSEIRIACN